MSIKSNSAFNKEKYAEAEDAAKGEIQQHTSALKALGSRATPSVPAVQKSIPLSPPMPKAPSAPKLPTVHPALGGGGASVPFAAGGQVPAINPAQAMALKQALAAKGLPTGASPVVHPPVGLPVAPPPVVAKPPMPMPPGAAPVAAASPARPPMGGNFPGIAAMLAAKKAKAAGKI